MKIATWNVNSVKARLPVVQQWLEEAAPDVACFQEIKSTDENFPAEAFEDMGYNVAVHGQKTYNGVAILSKTPIEDVTTGLPGDKSDEQARYIEAEIAVPDNKRWSAVRVVCIYLPNGNPLGTDKFDYKLKWMDRLTKHARKLRGYEEPLVIAGDYNVIPTPEDVHDPEAWAGDALFQPESRGRFRELLHEGFTDAIRACHTEAGLYTFWDYQGGAWQKNNGIRIDHMLLSPQAADLLEAAGIDKHVRAWEKPSDHVPVWIDLDL